MGSSTCSPRVSVVMPVHDTPVRFMAEAIESVFEQDLSDWELVIVLDGATPGCADLAKATAVRDPGRVRVVGWGGGEPGGLSAARNRGIAQTTAPYVAMLDADDVFLPRKLAEQSALLDRHPEAAMAYGRTVYWHSWNTDRPREAGQDRVSKLGVAPDVLIPPPRLLASFFAKGVDVPCPCSVVARRSAIEAVGGFNEDFRGDLQLIEDQAFYGRLCLRFPVVVSDAVWDRYRRHPDSITAKAGHPRLAIAWNGYIEWLAGETRRAGVSDAALDKALERAQWRIRNPGFSRVIRLTKKAFNKLASKVVPPRDAPTP